MIKMCTKCSNLDLEEVKKIVPKEKLDVTCMGICSNTPYVSIVEMDGEFVTGFKKVVMKKIEDYEKEGE